MFKRVIILGVLSLVLIALVLLKSHTASPVNNPNTKSNDSSEYTIVEYKINKIEGNQYYGKSNDGTGIIFSTQNIVSVDEIEVDDVVLCYFEKDMLGNGLVKVEKK